MSLRPDQVSLALALFPTLPVFQGATPEQLAALTAAVEFKTLATGKVILLEQEISKTLYILAQGSVGIWRRKNNQKERLALLRAPDVFGEISMFSDTPATALVKTEEAGHFFVLTRERFDAIVARDPAFGELMHKNIDSLRVKRSSASPQQSS